MAKKQKSFAERAISKGKKDAVHVKFVKSVPAEREGFWRFNESMIKVAKGQDLDAALKQLEDEAKLADIEMPSIKEVAIEETSIEEAKVEEVVGIEATASEGLVEEVEAEKEATETESTEEKAE
ncbi:MAG: hypothetical protein U9N31_02715 [Candidatus Marinimicrobia bacterium]|nr:hypothetical protein [Candidatus Neomarinimicrobiota bacterium]